LSDDAGEGKVRARSDPRGKLTERGSVKVGIKPLLCIAPTNGAALMPRGPFVGA